MQKNDALRSLLEREVKSETAYAVENLISLHSLDERAFVTSRRRVLTLVTEFNEANDTSSSREEYRVTTQES